MSRGTIVTILVLFIVIAGGVLLLSRGGDFESDTVFTPSTLELNKTPENNEQIETTPPVVIDTSIAPEKACVQSGCNKELCVEEGSEFFSTCQAPTIEQSCLIQYAFCERQTSGSCGWTQTEKYTQCMLEVTEK